MMHPAGRGIDPVHTLGTAENATYYSQGRHPGVAGAMAWLAFSHLPDDLKPYARPFYQSATELLGEIPQDSAELTTALNRLVEAKDWAVRAGIRARQGRPGPAPRPTEVVDPPIDPANLLPVHQYGHRADDSVRPRPIKDNPQA